MLQVEGSASQLWLILTFVLVCFNTWIWALTKQDLWEGLTNLSILHLTARTEDINMNFVHRVEWWRG